MAKPLEGGIAKALYKGMKAAKMTQPATLIKVTAGTRTPTNPGGGTNPTTVSYPARGFVPTASAVKIGDTLVEEGDRVLALFGASLPSGIHPGTADKITINGETLRIMAVETDAAKALYTVLARK